MEGNQVSARRGEEYVINRGMYLCNSRFSWREIVQEMAWPSRRVQKRVYFSFSLLSMRICDRSPQFLVNCFEKIVMATNNSWFNSTYMFACKWRATGKRKKRKGIEQELTGEEDLCGIWGVFTDSSGWQSFASACDVFTCLFALDPQNEIQLLSTFFCCFWLACWLGCGWKIRRSKKEIGNHRFKKYATLSKLTSPCWTMKKVITWWTSELHLDR